MNKHTVTLLAAVCGGVLFLGATDDANAGPPMSRPAVQASGLKVRGPIVRGSSTNYNTYPKAFHAKAPLSYGIARSVAGNSLGGGPGYGFGGYGLGGYGFGGGFSNFGFGIDPPDGLSLYRRRLIPVPPYFALHPPVYYSAPVARSYGYSPFPYSGDVRTPEPVETAAPAAMIENPYAEPVDDDEQTKPEATDDSVAEVSPEMIRNPFVDMTIHDREIHVAKTVEP